MPHASCQTAHTIGTCMSMCPSHWLISILSTRWSLIYVYILLLAPNAIFLKVKIHYRISFVASQPHSFVFSSIQLINILQKSLARVNKRVQEAMQGCKELNSLETFSMTSHYKAISCRSENSRLISSSRYFRHLPSNEWSRQYYIIFKLP